MPSKSMRLSNSWKSWAGYRSKVSRKCSLDVAHVGFGGGSGVLHSSPDRALDMRLRILAALWAPCFQIKPRQTWQVVKGGSLGFSHPRFTHRRMLTPRRNVSRSIL
jgi:hypothetical protein